MTDASCTVDGATIAAASIDGVGVVSDNQYEFVNERLVTIHGCETADDLVGRVWEDLYRPTSETVTSQDVLNRARNSGEWCGSAVGTRCDGTDVPVDLSLHTSDGRVVCVVRDSSSGETPGRQRPNRVDERAEDWAGQQGRERYETIIETVQDGIYALDEDRRFAFVNEALCEMLGRSEEELLGTDVMELFNAEAEKRLANEVRKRVVAGDTGTGTIEGTYEPADGTPIHTEARFRLHPSPDEGFAGSVGVVRDITARKEREQRLERQRDELETLNRINQLLFDIVRELVGTRSLEVIRQTVCNRLATSSLYLFAWIGEPDASGDRIVPQVCAGVDDDYVESIVVRTDGADTGGGPGGRAFNTGEVQVSQDVRSDPSFEPWRDAALERGVRSAAAIPLVSGETVYGILAVYADRPLGFTEREQQTLQILGETIGFAINAVRTHRLLFAGQVIELEFHARTPVGVLMDTSDELFGSLSLTGYVDAGERLWLCYVSVPTDDAERFRDAAMERSTVQTSRLVGTNGDRRIVAVTTRSPLFDTIARLGGRITSMTAEDSQGQFVVEVPRAVGSSEFVERVRSDFPQLHLAAKRCRERPIERTAWLSKDFPVDLTDCQRQALETAHRAGYFEWPRESTADEVAELLDISRPTLHAHLRKAQAELLSVYFGEDQPL
ncbi:bacterio-opsin activator [Salinigranum rubrum]|uniref:Bacterio-opsin activator n=1 Tax=Salinigranum rubrum TaxID=755307 RepID=A0A2I8VN83_9EURY|nr:bacterio-opsin activator domain-containing protein [Salinigranum rubrum]AUV82549.1 bacterio-opsin activator [Salinigranum rubrum]